MHTAEAGAVAGMRRTLPPTVRRPGAVGAVFDSVRCSCEVAVLRALTRGRIGGRAENLNLREEENLHCVCVNRRALTAGRGLFIDALKHSLQVGRKCRKQSTSQPSIHSGAGKAAAVCIRAVHRASSSHKVLHTERDTGLTRAVRLIVMAKAHNNESQFFTGDGNINLVAYAPK